MEIFDHLDRKLNFPETPGRIVSLVPSLTELIVDLGLENNLLGITKFCVHPEHLRKEKTIVGGTKSIHIDKIAVIAPDIILCNKEENTEEIVTSLEAIAPVHVCEVKTTSDIFKLIADYGLIFQIPSIARTLIDEIEKKLNKFRDSIASRKQKTCIYLIWKKPFMAAGSDTFINEMLCLNSYKNIVGQNRYPELSLKEILDLAPDEVLLSTEPYPFKAGHKKELEKLGLKVRLVDGEFFSWYGSRLIEAFDYFETL